MIRYSSTPDPAFAKGIRTFAWEDWVVDHVKVGRLASGPCPRCGHTIALYRDIVLGLDGSPWYEALCNCDETHKGRPSDKTGCGQSAQLDLTGWDPEFDR